MASDEWDKFISSLLVVFEQDELGDQPTLQPDGPDFFPLAAQTLPSQPKAVEYFQTNPEPFKAEDRHPGENEFFALLEAAVEQDELGAQPISQPENFDGFDFFTLVAQAPLSQPKTVECLQAIPEPAKTEDRHPGENEFFALLEAAVEQDELGAQPISQPENFDGFDFFTLVAQTPLSQPKTVECLQAIPEPAKTEARQPGENEVLSLLQAAFKRVQPSAQTTSQFEYFDGFDVFLISQPKAVECPQTNRQPAEVNDRPPAEDDLFSLIEDAFERDQLFAQPTSQPEYFDNLATQNPFSKSKAVDWLQKNQEPAEAEDFLQRLLHFDLKQPKQEVDLQSSKSKEESEVEQGETSGVVPGPTAQARKEIGLLQELLWRPIVDFRPMRATVPLDIKKDVQADSGTTQDDQEDVPRSSLKRENPWMNLSDEIGAKKILITALCAPFPELPKIEKKIPEGPPPCIFTRNAIRALTTVRGRPFDEHLQFVFRMTQFKRDVQSMRLYVEFFCRCTTYTGDTRTYITRDELQNSLEAYFYTQHFPEMPNKGVTGRILNFCGIYNRAIGPNGRQVLSYAGLHLNLGCTSYELYGRWPSEI